MRAGVQGEEPEQPGSMRREHPVRRQQGVPEPETRYPHLGSDHYERVCQHLALFHIRW